MPGHKLTGLDIQAINTIRTLSMDAVERAASGHPGAPMGLAPLGYVLWREILKHNPKNPKWINRDRFILSAGHASMWLYSLLFLTGYDVSLEDIKNFRQLDSLTPGHPEYGRTQGVETTTGPLGQGFANGVGMAVAERYLAARYNRPDAAIIDHYTYAVVSDGDMMEGVSSEAASLAGQLGLGKLIYFYDANKITIDGSTDLSMNEDVAKRFEAYGWHVNVVIDANHDLDGIRKAVQIAKKETLKPSLIILRTSIGYGSPNKQDSESSHGAPLGADEVRLTKEALGWPIDKEFYVADDVLKLFRKAVDEGNRQEEEWNKTWDIYRKKYLKEAEELLSSIDHKLPENWASVIPKFVSSDGAMATRSASGKVLNALADVLPNLIGGSADLTGSNNTELKGKGIFSQATPAGRNIYFGVREHAMGGIINGVTLHKGVLIYSGTFLIFSDYMRPSIRLSALMRIPSIFVFTHDSIGLGEDGPTHQPIEHLASLRAIPFLNVIRPADANEVSWAWQAALERTDGPTTLILTRHKIPIIDREKYASAEGLLKGAYILKKESSSNGADIVLMASGSEVTLALDAAVQLEKENISTRVVSFPSWELFNQQTDSYRASVLGSSKHLVIEAGVPQGWRDYIGLEGDVIGMERFGASAPAKDLFQKFGFTVDNIVKKTKILLQKSVRL
ncbi:transketolase [PVC group bacterium]|nr:transketolase [PVC group bacterium]